jgi:hypothetical protein
MTFVLSTSYYRLPLREKSPSGRSGLQVAKNDQYHTGGERRYGHRCEQAIIIQQGARSIRAAHARAKRLIICNDRLSTIPGTLGQCKLMHSARFQPKCQTTWPEDVCVNAGRPALGGKGVKLMHGARSNP